MLRRMEATEVAALRRTLQSVCIVLLLQSIAVWTSATSSSVAPPAAGAGAAAGAGTAHGAAAGAAHGAAAGAEAATATNGTADAAGRAGGGHQHKCTNAKLFSECRVHCEYVVEGKGAYFVFTDGEDGLPCKTRTLDGEVLDGACSHGLCLVKNGRAAAEPTAMHTAGAPGTAGAAAAAGAAGTAAPVAGTAAPKAAGADAAHPGKHSKA